MRREPKFKIYIKCKSFLLSCPSKLLKFKHAKWKFYQNILQKNLTRRYFFNSTVTSPKLKTIERKKQFFKQRLVLKRQLSQTFDTAIKLKKIKKTLKRLKGDSKFNSLFFLKNSILKFEYNLAVLLFRLNVFSNIFESRNFIENNRILVNSKPASHNYFLKKGDVILFNNSSLTNIKKQIQLPIFIPFVEIDFYNGNIVIVKDLDELSKEDITLFSAKYLDLPKLRYTLYKS